MASWRSRLARLEGEGFGPVLGVLDTRDSDRGAALANPPARTDGTKGNRSAYFASQIEASRTLRDRLNRDVVTLHPDNDTPLDDAA